MRYLIFDTETERFNEGTWRTMVPPTFVAMGWRWDDEDQVHITQDYSTAQHVLVEALAQGHCLVGHNLAFDCWIMELLPHRGDQLWDTQVADLLQRLAWDDCAGDQPGPPKYRTLESLYGAPLPGKGTTQTSFRPGIPLTQEQREYLTGDVRATHSVWQRQQRRGVPGGIPEMVLQVRAGMAFRKLSVTGLTLDLDEIGRQRRHLQRLQHRAAMVLQRAAIYRPERTGPRGGKYPASLSMSAIRAHVGRLCQKLHVGVGHTDKGSISTARDFLNGFRNDPVVHSYLEYKNDEKLMGFLTQWQDTGGSVHPVYRTMVRSGRASAASPNLMQVPSRGAREQLKKVFVAPPGRQLYELDYGQIELCALAYLTNARMRELINAGHDLHRELGSVYFRKPASEVSKPERQLLKCASFGLPGGMGTAKFRAFVRSNGLPDPGHEAAVDLKNAWLAAFPEMGAWLQEPFNFHAAIWAGRQSGPALRVQAAWERAHAIARERRDTPGMASIPSYVYEAINRGEGGPAVERWLVGRRVTISGGRQRHPVSYTESRNAPMQGLAANLTKDALARVALDYIGDVQIHAYIHDSLLISVVDEQTVRDVAQIMLDAAHTWLPGIRVGVEACGPGHNWFEAKKTEFCTFFGDFRE